MFSEEELDNYIIECVCDKQEAYVRCWKMELTIKQTIFNQSVT